MRRSWHKQFNTFFTLFIYLFFLLISLPLLLPLWTLHWIYGLFGFGTILPVVENRRTIGNIIDNRSTNFGMYFYSGTKVTKSHKLSRLPGSWRMKHLLQIWVTFHNYLQHPEPFRPQANSTRSTNALLSLGSFVCLAPMTLHFRSDYRKFHKDQSNCRHLL